MPSVMINCKCWDTKTKWSPSAASAVTLAQMFVEVYSCKCSLPVTKNFSVVLPYDALWLQLQLCTNIWAIIFDFLLNVKHLDPDIQSLSFNKYSTYIFFQVTKKRLTNSKRFLQPTQCYQIRTKSVNMTFMEKKGRWQSWGRSM